MSKMGGTRCLRFAFSLDQNHPIYRNVIGELGYGMCAGTCSILAAYPIDTIKTLMQTGASRSVGSTICNTFREGGIARFYRGFTIPMISQPMYTVYEHCIDLCKRDAFVLIFHVQPHCNYRGVRMRAWNSVVICLTLSFGHDLAGQQDFKTATNAELRGR